MFKKIALVRKKFVDISFLGLDNLITHEMLYAPNLGLASLYSVLKKRSKSLNLDLGFFDAELYNFEDKILLEKIKNFNPKTILITVTAQQLLLDNIIFIKKIKKFLPNSKIILGGYGVSFLSEYILNNYPYVDAIMNGEAEELIVDLINNERMWKNIDGLSFRLGNEIFINNNFIQVDNLDSIPLSYRSLDKKSHAVIEGSRGCSFKCNFCSISKCNNNKWRAKSISRIMKEINHLIVKDVRNVTFIDAEISGGDIDTFKERSSLLIDGFNRINKKGFNVNFYFSCRTSLIYQCPETFKKLKEAGLSSVLVGVESGSDIELNLMNKGINVEINKKALNVLFELDITPVIDIILFPFDSTKESVKNTLDFLMNLYSDYPSKYFRIDGFNRESAYMNTLRTLDYMKNENISIDSLVENNIMSVKDKNINEVAKKITSLVDHADRVFFILFNLWLKKKNKYLKRKIKENIYKILINATYECLDDENFNLDKYKKELINIEKRLQRS